MSDPALILTNNFPVSEYNNAFRFEKLNPISFQSKMMKWYGKQMGNVKRLDEGAEKDSKKAQKNRPSKHH
jgi:hypothetical protein